MKDKAVELLKIFYDNGYEAYVVGGFVRDLILGKESFDIDITTNATPKEIKQMFNNVTLPFEQYGAVKLIFKNISFEITTYRMESEYKDKRKPSKILYTNDLLTDLKRRDFTINAICMDKDGKIIDLLNGMNDIKRRVIKTIGVANLRIKEDSLRILRAIRFAQDLDFRLSDDLKKAIIDNRTSLINLSFFRKKQELNKIFSSKNALKGISLLKELGLDLYLDINLNHEIVKTSDPIGIWAQVNPSDNYQFTRNEKDYLKAILRVIKDSNINDLELYKEGNYVCYIASQILKTKEVNIYNRYDALPIKKRSDIKINGKEIIEVLKLKDKSKVKQILNDIEEKIILNKLDNKKEKLLEYVIDTYTNNVV